MNALYSKGKEHILRDGLSGDTLKVVLVDAGQYAPNLTTHQYLSDIPAGARVATTAALTGVTYTGGVLDASNPALPDVGGGATGELLVLFADTGDPATSPLLMLIDTAAGLPITEDSTEDSLQWDAAGLFAL